MTDQQFQPGQPIPPTQGGGVFGGNPEEIIHDPTMFGPLEEIAAGTENKKNEEANPFDGFVIPQDISDPEPAVETVVEPDLNIEKTPIMEEPKMVVEESKPIIEETAPITKEIEPIVEEDQTIVDEKIETEPENELSDIQQKFNSLSNNVSELGSLLRLKDGEIIEIIGSNNDQFSILYQFGMNDQKDVNIKRIETNKEDDETSFNELKFSINNDSNYLEVFLDEVLLFEESELLEDPRKKSQVMEKLNKFIFLTESKLKDVQKEIKIKQEEEQERRKMQDIFRNF